MGRSSSPAVSATAAVSALLVAVPFLAVELPPITDLPQQAAQIRLLGEALGGAEGELRVQWLHPNKLGYLPVAAAWPLAGPLAAGRLGLLAIGLLWVAAIHHLVRRRGRPPATAVLATLFFFNHLTYWGFLNFLAGLPVFVLWFLHLEPRREARGGAAPGDGASEPPGGDAGGDATGGLGWRDGAHSLGLALLLAAAHVLWLAAAVAWLLVSAVASRRPRRAIARRLLWMSPALAAVALWYPSLSAAGFDSATFWGRSPVGRLHPEWLVGAAFGGLRGAAEPLLLTALLGWLALGTWQARRELRRSVDPGLFAAGGLFAAAALTLPGVEQQTIFFASRWLPVAAVFTLLGSPQPRLRPGFRLALALLLLAGMSAATTAAWLGFEREELTGLPGAIAALPASRQARLLGLDTVRTSPRIRGYPYYHLHAYAQVAKGVRLQRSFAGEASSLVVYRDLPRRVPWTEGLDWKPQKLRRSDLDHFDYLLLHGGAEMHAYFGRDPRLRPLTAPAPWRLYAIGEP